MDVVRLAEVTNDVLIVRRVFGEAYECDGVTVIPCATVRGGAGGGGGKQGRADGKEEDEGEGGGFVVLAKPAGVYVVSGGKVRWVPPVDVNRIVAGGQLVGLAAILLVRLIIRRRAV